MKKILIILATFACSLTACADNQQLINYSELPVQAQAFVQKYFNIADITYIERERDVVHFEYKVYLKNATEIEFDNQGNLELIDCQVTPVPEGIVPDLIVQYVLLHHPNTLIVEYAIERRTLKVELSNSLELIFDLEGHFIRIDD